MTTKRDMVRFVPLEEVTDLIQYGYTAKSGATFKGPKYLRITDIQGAGVDWNAVPRVTIDAQDFERYRLTIGDIVFARSGATVGKSYLIQNDPGEAIFASYLIRVRCRPDAVDPKYAAYFFQSEQYWNQIREGATGTGQPNFNGTKLARLLLPLRPLHEQRLIVSKLDSLLARSRRARFELFRVPDLVSRYKQAVLATAFGGDLDDSGTHDWREKRLGDIADLQLGKMLDKAKNRGTPVSYLRNVNVRWFAFDLSDLLQMRFSDAEQQKFSIKDGDILICEGGEPGRAAVWRNGETTLRYQKALHRARVRKGCRPEWIVYQLYHAASLGKLAEHFTGTTIKHLPQEALAAVPFLVPPESTQDRLLKLIEHAFRSMDALSSETARALKLIDRLDQFIFAGTFGGEPFIQQSNQAAEVRPESVRPSRRAQSAQTERGTREASGAATTADNAEGGPMGKRRADVDENHLTEALRALGGIADATALWQRSQMDIDEFYKQLRDEIRAGRIEEGSSKERLKLANAT
jgi:type I restriction enzyme, S subunit